MSFTVSNKLLITLRDANNKEIEFSVANINPNVSDTSILRTAAQNLADLSSNSLSKVYMVQTVDITSDSGV